MENASKALIMAGSILISVMIISLGVYVFKMFGDYASNIENKREEQQIAEFNAQFLKYENMDQISAHDIVSVINLAKENNEKYGLTSGNSNNFYVSVSVSGTTYKESSNEDELQTFIQNNSGIHNVTYAGTDIENVPFLFNVRVIEYR